jgi:hypothetical protein
LAAFNFHEIREDFASHGAPPGVTADVVARTAKVLNRRPFHNLLRPYWAAGYTTVIE